MKGTGKCGYYRIPMENDAELEEEERKREREEKKMKKEKKDKVKVCWVGGCIRGVLRNIQLVNIPWISTDACIIHKV